MIVPLLKSLRNRLLLGTLVSLLVMLFVAQIFMSDLFERHVEQRVHDELNERLNFMGAKLDNALGAGSEQSAGIILGEELARLEPGYQRPLSGYYWQVTTNGQTLRSRSLWDASLNISGDNGKGSIDFIPVQGPGDQPLIAAMRTVSRSIVIDGRRTPTVAHLIATVPRSEVRDALRAFKTEIDVYLWILGILLFLVGMVQIQIASHPLNRIRNAVSAIRRGMIARLPGTGPSELTTLVSEMNDLLDALDQAVEKARSRAADLAHGLKTPLTVIQGEMEHLRHTGAVTAEQAEGIEQAVEQLENHIRRELVRARVRGSTTGAITQLAIRPHVTRIVQILGRLPQASGIDFVITIDEDASLAIDASDFTEILGNLLENAIRHARTEIAINYVAGTQNIILSIRDDGPGVEESELGNLKLRGHRLDEHMHGSGLGLAIVEDIVEAYNGRLELESQHNHHFQARLIFPAPAD